MRTALTLSRDAANTAYRLALIEQAAVIERILRHLGLPDAVPAPSPARAPPLPLVGGWSAADRTDTDIDSGL